MDEAIFEQAEETIERLCETLAEGQYDHQTGNDIRKAQNQIRNLLQWLRVANREYADLDQSWQRLATEVRLLRDKLDKVDNDDTLQVIRFD